MTAPTNADRDAAHRLLGQLDYMLDYQFLRYAYMGGMFRDAPPQAVAGLAIRQAQTPSADFHWPGTDEQICHDALCALVTEGHPLPRAAGMARRSPLGRAAFERLEDKAIDKLQASLSTKGDQA